MRENRKTAVYLRISAEDMDLEAEKTESISITSQRELLMEYVGKDRELSAREVLEYCDDGFSGTSMERPGMQAMLGEVRKNRIGCIVVKDMSRFSRDYIEMGTYLNQIFPFMGVDFISVNDGYDSREHGGNTIAIDTAFQTLLYDLYSKDISVKMKASIESRCAGGQYVFGQVPLGYEKSREVKNGIVVNEREAEIVRSIFSMAVKGMNCAEIARRLFEEGIPTATQLRKPETRESKKCLTWSPTTIRKILNNRFYLGEMAYGKSIRKSVGSKEGIKVSKDQWKVIRDHHEPLVTPEVFAQVSSPASKQPVLVKKRRGLRHPLAGKIYCGGCGYALGYKSGTKGRKSGQFGCGRHAVLQIPECCTCLQEIVLEEIVLTLLNRELVMRGEVIKERKSLEWFQEGALEEFGNRVSQCRKEYQRIQEEKDSLYISYAAGKTGVQEYRDKAGYLEEKLREVVCQIEAAEAKYNRMEEELQKDKQEMKQIVRFAHLEELTQEVADVFIEKVVVYGNRRVEIKWNFLELGEAV